MGRISARELLQCSDPLSDEACLSLINYGEEDELVDFKESFDPSLGKSWIDLSIDCVAFANTFGGFIVFGVENRTWRHLGVDRTPRVELKAGEDHPMPVDDGGNAVVGGADQAHALLYSAHPRCMEVLPWPACVAEPAVVGDVDE